MYLYEAEIPLVAAITSKYCACAGFDVPMIMLHVFIACLSVRQPFVNKNRDQAKIMCVDARDKAMGNLPLEILFQYLKILNLIDMSFMASG